mgnify:CR=1 FL=1
MQLRANRGTEMESEGENSYAADQGETLSGFCSAIFTISAADLRKKQVCHMCVTLVHSDSFHGHFVRFVAGVVAIDEFVPSVQQDF